MIRLFLICLLLCLLTPFSAQAAPTVTIEPGAAGVPDQAIEQIADDYPRAGSITIIDYHTAESIQGAEAQAPSRAAAPVILLIGLAAGMAILYIRHKGHTA